MTGNRIIDLHRAREMILDMVACDGATFSTVISERHREELVEIRAEYEICGVHYSKTDGTLKLILSVNSMDPPEVDVDPERFKGMLMLDIPRNLPFLVKGTYSISFDMNSLRDVNRLGKLGRFKEEMAMAIEAYGFTMDEILPTIMEFVKSALGESSYGTVEDLLKGPVKGPDRPRPVLEITPPGVPCPHCNGHLSEEALRRLLMRLYMRHRDHEY